MTNAQTEAREIAERLTDYGLTLDPNVVICDRRVVDEAATALAAKDAELVGARADALKVGDQMLAEKFRAERAEAQLAEANKALDQIAAIEPQSNCDAGSMARSRMRDIARLYIARRAREAQGEE